MKSGEILAAAGSGLFAPLMAFLLVVIVSFLLCLIAGMDNDTVADFFTANRSLSVARNALALCGDYIPTTALLSSVGAVALGGYDGMIVAVSAIAALAVLLLLAEPVRNTGRFTLGDILASRVTGTATRVAGTVITVAVCLPLMVVQLTVAGDVTAYVLGVNRPGAAQVCTILLGLLIVSFAAFGGMRGSSMIEIGKVIIVFGTVLTVSCAALSRSDWDLGTMLETAARHSGGAASYYAPGLLYGNTATGRLDLVSLCVTIVLGSAVFPHILLRVSASRNGPAARRASSAAVVMITLFHGAMVLTGLSAAATLGAGIIASGDPQGNTALFLLADALAGGGGGLLFTMVACAAFVTALSTVAGLTLAASASLAHDLYAKVARRGAVHERREVNVARAAVMVFGVVSVYLAVTLHNWSIVALSSFAAALTASAVLPALVYSLFWKGFTRTGLLWTLYGSLVCCAVLEAFGPAVSGGPLALFPAQDFHWFPLQNIALASVPVGFLLGWAGSMLSRRSLAGQDRYAETQSPRSSVRSRSARRERVLGPGERTRSGSVRGVTSLLWSVPSATDSAACRAGRPPPGGRPRSGRGRGRPGGRCGRRRGGWRRPPGRRLSRRTTGVEWRLGPSVGSGLYELVEEAGAGPLGGLTQPHRERTGRSLRGRLRGQVGEEGFGVGAVDGREGAGVHAAVEAVGEVLAGGGGREGPVAAEQDVSGAGEGEQGRQGGGTGGEGGVVVEAAEIVQDVEGAASGVGRDGDGHAVGGVGDEAAGVAEDEPYVRVTAGDAVADEKVGGAGGVEEEVGGERGMPSTAGAGRSAGWTNTTAPCASRIRHNASWPSAPR